MDRRAHRRRTGLIEQVGRRAAGTGHRERRLVVLLHGYQDDPSSWLGLTDTLDPGGRFDFVIPRAPFETPGGPAWFAADLERSPDERLADSLTALDALIATEAAALDLAPTATTVVGYSQGGATALALAFRAGRPVTYAAVAVLAGYLPSAEDLEWDFITAAGVTKTLIVHGTDDEAVPVLQARSATKVLGRNDVDYDFAEVDTGHGLGPTLVAPLIRWLETTTPS